MPPACEFIDAESALVWTPNGFHIRAESSLHLANERRRYKVKPSLIGWAQT